VRNKFINLKRMIRYHVKSFNELTTEELYDVLKLRSEVFVVEQNCIYQDMDDKDLLCYHVLGKLPNSELLSYARIVPPKVSYTEPSIGRVLVRMLHRKGGAGYELMRFTLNETKRLYPDFSIKISAQAYLESFYQNLGFTSLNDHYLEDGIPHLAMIWQH